MSEYELRLCSVDDAPGLAKNNASAFWEEEWWNILWVNRTLPSLIESLTMRLPTVLLTDRSVRRHQKVVHFPSGEVVGYARWIVPSSQSDALPEWQIPDVSDDLRKAFAETHAAADWNARDLDNMDDPIHEMMQRHEPKNPYIKLDYLCSRPDHQRQGIASMLVQSGIIEAQKLGMDIFLVAMGRGALSMYQRLGFELLEESCQHLSQWGGKGLYETFILVKKVEK